MDSSDLEGVDLEETDFIFEKPKRIIVTGSSNTGKTNLKWPNVWLKKTLILSNC